MKLLYNRKICLHVVGLKWGYSFGEVKSRLQTNFLKKK